MSQDRGPRTFRSRVQPILPKMGSKIQRERFFNAIYSRNIPEINVFLNRGVNPNVRSSEYGVAPLHLLAERNDYVLGYRLMEAKDVNLELRTVHGFTPLHLACMFNCKRFVMMLIQHGVDLNSPDRFGKTPLHLAVEREYYGIVMKLLKAGARVNVVDCFENTPLSLSIINVNNLLIAKSLMQYGVNMSIEHKRSLHIFFEAILNCRTVPQIDFILLILDHGVNINMRQTASGRTCLHFVAITGYLDLAVVLIEKGANWAVIDIRNRTPAKAAAEHGNFILADYFRKGYRPPHLLKTIPLLFKWSKKLKARLAAKRAEQEENENIVYK